MKNGIVCFAIKRYTVTINGISVSPSWFLAVQRTVNWREINGIPLYGTFEKRYRIFAKKRYNVIVSVSPSWFCCTFNMPSIAVFRQMYRKLAKYSDRCFWHFEIKTSLEFWLYTP